MRVKKGFFCQQRLVCSHDADTVSDVELFFTKAMRRFDFLFTTVSTGHFSLE